MGLGKVCRMGQSAGSRQQKIRAASGGSNMACRLELQPKRILLAEGPQGSGAGLRRILLPDDLWRQHLVLAQGPV